jgi:arylsulfatase
MRYGDWKVVFLENRGEAFGVWREPFVELRVPLLFNLRRDPFERAQHNSNTYNDWFLSRALVIVPLQGMAARFLSRRWRSTRRVKLRAPSTCRRSRSS